MRYMNVSDYYANSGTYGGAIGASNLGSTDYSTYANANNAGSGDMAAGWAMAAIAAYNAYNQSQQAGKAQQQTTDPTLIEDKPMVRDPRFYAQWNQILGGMQGEPGQFDFAAIDKTPLIQALIERENAGPIVYGKASEVQPLSNDIRSGVAWGGPDGVQQRWKDHYYDSENEAARREGWKNYWHGVRNNGGRR